MANKINRRDFLKKASVATVAGGTGLLVGCSIGQPQATSAPAQPTEAPVEESAAGGATQADATEEVAQDVNINKNQTIQWKIVTTWPPTLPIMMDGVRLMAEQIKTMSQGRLEIEVFGAGELVPPFESFDAVGAGTAEMSHGASYYWGGKAPAAKEVPDKGPGHADHSFGKRVVRISTWGDARDKDFAQFFLFDVVANGLQVGPFT